MINIAIFASGSGTNAQNLIEHFNRGDFAHIPIVICNKPNAYVLERAKKLSVKSYILSKEELCSNSPNLLISILKEYNIDYIILAGYLLKIPKAIIELYKEKIINIHPALLPKYGGKGMYGEHVHKAVVNAKEKVSGITIHLVDEKYDNGAHLFQASCPIDATDSADDVAAKIHQLEQAHFPSVVEKYIRGE